MWLQADAHVDMEKKSFYESSMQYVLVLQEVQERKKFEFVETVSRLCVLNSNQPYATIQLKVLVDLLCSFALFVVYFHLLFICHICVLRVGK